MKLIHYIKDTYKKLSIVAKATLWFVFATTLQKAVSVVTTPIFTRLMSTEQYGQVSSYNSWLEIFLICVTLRLDWAVFNKGMSKFKNDRDGYTSTMQTISFGLACVMTLLYILFKNQVNALTELPTFIMVAILADLFVRPAISYWTIRKRYEYQYRQVVFRSVAMVIASALLGIVVVLMSEEKGYARILSVIFVNVCVGVPIFIYNRVRSSVWFKLEYALYAVRFNLKLFLHYVSHYILDHFDRIMILKMVGFAAAGIYSVAYNAAMLLKMLTQSITNALIPWMYERLEKREFRELDDMLFVIYLLVGSIVLSFVAVAPEIMRLMAGPRYYGGVYVIPPVTLGLFFLYIYNTIANVEFFYEHTQFTSYISMLGAALNVVLNYFGIQMFGYVAAAYTTLLCYMFYCTAHYSYTIHCIKKQFELERVFSVKRLLALSSVVLIAGLVMIFAYNNFLVRYAVIAVFVVVIYWKRNMLKRTLKAVRSVKK